MKYNLKMIALAAAGLVGLGVAGVAIAEASPDREDATEREAFITTPVSLSAAIAAAEKATGARAMSAEFDVEDDIYVYSIELVSADGVEIEAEIDAKTASVVKSEADDEKDSDETEGEEKAND